jgi:hypothetical protein
MSGNNKGVNITQFLSRNQNKPPSTSFASTGTYKSVTSNSTAGAKASSIGRILSYLLAILIVIIVILLFIHFFITPIFKLRPGGPGIIPVPGFDDGKLFWNKTSAGQVLNTDTPISSQSFGYTINLDVFIENPLQFSQYPRIFFSRGAVRKEKPSGDDTILSILDNYNIVAALLADTNDLLVSVLNSNNNMENIVIPNAPIQEPFRLTMVVMEQALEVYINGHLMKTRTFLAPPKDVKGDIYPATGIEANIVKDRNLKIWPRLLSVSEIREATPKLSTAKDFGGVPMPSSTTCSTAASTTMTSVEKGMDRFQKLSVDSISDASSKLL